MDEKRPIIKFSFCGYVNYGAWMSEKKFQKWCDAELKVTTLLSNEFHNHARLCWCRIEQLTGSREQ